MNYELKRIEILAFSNFFLSKMGLWWNVFFLHKPYCLLWQFRLSWIVYNVMVKVNSWMNLALWKNVPFAQILIWMRF